MTKDINYYRGKGCDMAMAQYYAAGRKRIVAVTPNPDFTLLLVFNSGERRLYDCKPLLSAGAIFDPLKCKEVFQRVYLDSAHCVAWDIDPTLDSEIVWNNKIDLCPDSCYVDSVPIGGADNV